MAELLRKGYPQDVTDEEWAFVLPYLLLSREDSLSRKHSLRELLNGVRYIVRTGNQWRYMPKIPSYAAHTYPDIETLQQPCATLTGFPFYRTSKPEVGNMHALRVWV